MSAERRIGQRFYLAFDPDYDPEKSHMKFRLTYEGRLEGNGTPKHKHEIRQKLHPQLKRLWAVEPNLTAWRLPGYSILEKAFEYVIVTEGHEDSQAPAVEVLATRYRRGNYRFVPLATQSHSLLASVEILFLRPDVPGGVIQSADLDNRLKTLFDALKMPRHEEEFGGYTNPADGEDPFFVLLEDDGLISHASVETDTLLQPTPTAKGEFLTNDARLIITVHLKPYFVTLDNLHFT